MKLSRTTAYAFQAMLRIADADPGVPVPCSHIARTGQLPERFLLQVLRCLVNRGLLISSRGIDGGYTLARPPSEITLGSIIEAFDNPFDVQLPELNGYTLQLRERVLEVLRLASDAARTELDKLSLEDFLELTRGRSTSEQRRPARAARQARRRGV